MRRILRGGRILDPCQKLDQVGHLVIEGQKIAAVLRPEQPLPEEAEIIPAEGLMVTPGLIDMHVHLRQPGQEYKEDIVSGTRAAAAGGFTCLACMPNTDPVNDSAAVSQFIIDTAAREGEVRVKVIAAATKGLGGDELNEYGELSELGVVGLSDDGKPIFSPAVLRRVMEYASNFNLTVIDHPEEPSLATGGQINEGPVSTRLGLKGIPAQAEEIAVHRDIAVSRLTGLPIHLAHISTAGSVELIRRAKADGLKVTAETAPHYFTLTDEACATYSTNAKMNPPLRTADDVEAIRAGLADGTLDCIATDHAPHAVLEKDVEFARAAFGIVGLETALPLALDLVRDGVLSPLDLVSRMSAGPARVLGLNHGNLKPGTAADVTIIDPEAKWTVEPDKFRSKGRNTPFGGWQMQGRAVMTIVNGRTVYRV